MSKPVSSCVPPRLQRAHNATDSTNTGLWERLAVSQRQQLCSVLERTGGRVVSRPVVRKEATDESR